MRCSNASVIGVAAAHVDRAALGGQVVIRPVVRDTHRDHRHTLGGLADLVIFPNMPGDPYAKSEEQMARFAEGVLAKL